MDYEIKCKWKNRAIIHPSTHSDDIIKKKPPGKPKQSNDTDWMQTSEKLCEWTPLTDYAPEFLDTELDIPSECINGEYFQEFE